MGKNETSAGGRLRTAAQDAAGCYDFAVSVMPGKVTVTGHSEDADARFILPIISPEGENVAWQDVNTVRIGSGPAALTVQADRPLTLPPEYGTPVRFRRLFKAKPGGKGEGSNKYGRNAEDLVITVPLGTIVKDEETGQVMADLSRDGQRAIVAKGGRGGRGNWHFRTSANRTPTFAERGEPGEERCCAWN